MTRSIPRPEPPASRVLPAVAAATLLATVMVAGVAGRRSGDDATPASSSAVAMPVATVAPPASTSVPMVVEAPTATPAPSLATTLHVGSSGEEVKMVQRQLKELGFEPGPIDGQFGSLTRAAVWAFEKLVLGTPRAAATGAVDEVMWQATLGSVAVVPRRPSGPGTDHTEVYLPEQVVVFFIGDRPALITHMSSGTGEQWCGEVAISPGEMGNEAGTEPLRRQECGISNTPGGVYHYHRRVEGIRQSALGSMWNPVYFNYGIAIHGALNVPLEPASHGCIRIPMAISETFQQYVHDGDEVDVFDGERPPEDYGSPPPTFNWLDRTGSTTSP